jgi:hypothetical protein
MGVADNEVAVEDRAWCIGEERYQESPLVNAEEGVEVTGLGEEKGVTGLEGETGLLDPLGEERAGEAPARGMARQPSRSVTKSSEVTTR